MASNPLTETSSIGALQGEVRVSEDGRHLDVGGEMFSFDDVVATLSEYVSDERQERIENVLQGRTSSVVPVIEGAANTGNVSAVLRSAEALGFQSVHVIANQSRYKTSSRSAQGADKWLDICVWDRTVSCLSHLRAEGYRIVATMVDPTASALEDVDFTIRTALLFGNEAEGITKEAKEGADELVVVRMPGFVESFNVSVAAAICLYQAMRDRINRTGRHGDLGDDELLRLRAQYYARSVRRAREILSRGRRPAT